MVFTRLSIGFFLIRIAVTRTIRRIIYTAMVLQTLIGGGFTFAAVFQCNPISYFWDHTIPGGSCCSVDLIIVIAYLVSVLFMILDMIFTILPVYLVWTLPIARKTKIMLIPILGLGSL